MTAGVNRAILELHQKGVLTSATLMSSAPCTEEALQYSAMSASLGTGCHVVLVDGQPILPAKALPTLVDQSTGRFRQSLGEFVRDCVSRRIRDAEIQAEAEAQIARLQAARQRITHVDTHKHTHMFPAVLRPVLAAAKQRGVRCIRNPFEPTWSVSATPHAPFLRRLQVRGLRVLERQFRRRVDNADLATTDGAAGVLATGTLDRSTLSRLMGAMPNGTWELVTHPGHSDADLRAAGTRLIASRDTEFQALSEFSFASDIELIHFGQAWAD